MISIWLNHSRGVYDAIKVEDSPIQMPDELWTLYQAHKAEAAKWYLYFLELDLNHSKESK